MRCMAAGCTNQIYEDAEPCAIESRLLLSNPSTMATVHLLR